MTRIIHCSDLHLAESDREYSLSVLNEILTISVQKKVHLLLIAGDLYDSLADAHGLHNSVRQAVESKGIQTLFLPGNHEELKRGKDKGVLASLDHLPLLVAQQKPFQLFSFEGGGSSVELLCIPYQKDYGKINRELFPSRSDKFRITVAHGGLPGAIPRVNDEEAESSLLDPELLLATHPDYIALGHIHKAGSFSIGTTPARYPGSARVWRAGEKGPRQVLLIETQPNMQITPLELPSAGQYRELVLPLSLEGKLPPISSLNLTESQNDYLEVQLSGIVEEEVVFRRELEAWEEELKTMCRVLEVRKEGVAVVPGLSTNPLARDFLQLWENAPAEAVSSEEELRVQMRAREMGLLYIKEAMERER